MEKELHALQRCKSTCKKRKLKECGKRCVDYYKITGRVVIDAVWWSAWIRANECAHAY